MKKILAIMLCVILMLSLSVTAFAAKNSPVGEEFHEVTLRAGEGVEGVTEPNIAVEIKAGNKVTVTADNDMGKFNNWIIYLDYNSSKAKEGEHYTIVSGSLTEKTITFIPKTDLIICGNYDGKITDPNTGEQKDQSDPTGDTAFIIVSLLFVSAAAVVVLGRKVKA